MPGVRRRQGRFRCARVITMIDARKRLGLSAVKSGDSDRPQVRHANKRGAARLTVQALYQMDVAGSGVFEITAEYEAFRLGKEVDGALSRGRCTMAFAPSSPASSRTRRPSIRSSASADRGLAAVQARLTLRAILRRRHELMKREDAGSSHRFLNTSISPRHSTRKTSRSWSTPCSIAYRAGARRGTRQGRPHDGHRVVAARAGKEARCTAFILAAAQAIIGSAAPIAISVGGLAGNTCLAPTSRWRQRRSPVSTRWASRRVAAAAIIRGLANAAASTARSSRRSAG